MKKMALLLVLILVLCSAGCKGTSEQQAEPKKETKNAFSSPANIDGYQRADFDKFNSPAEENGLGGTQIYVDGVFERIFEVEDGIYGRLKSNGNKWCIALSIISETSLSELSFLEGKKARIFGVYEGFAENFDMPALSCIKFTFLDTGECHHIYEFCSSASPVFEDLLDSYIEGGKKNNPPEKQENEEFDISGSTLIEKFTLVTGIKIEEFLNTPVDDIRRVVFKETLAKYDFRFAYHETLESKKVTGVDLTFNSDINENIFVSLVQILDEKSDMSVAKKIFDDLTSSLNDNSDSTPGTISVNGITYLMSVLEDCVIISIFK